VRTRTIAAGAAIALAAGGGIAGCSGGGGGGNATNGTSAVTITSCGLTDTGPEAGYSVTNETSQALGYSITVGFYQDGSEFTTGNDDPTLGANATYTGLIDDAPKMPSGTDPITCQVLTTMSYAP
jgi:hypothetical protein